MLPPAGGGGRIRLRRAAGARAAVGLLCVALIVAQLVWLLQWSWHELDSANLSLDFAINYQPWYLIAHGNLAPRSTPFGTFLFLRNDGELIVYLLAPLYWLFPNHQLGYLWLQDLAIVGVSAVCLRIVAERVPWLTTSRPRDQLVAAVARVLAVLVLVANPFVYWTASFDIHMESFGALFMVLLLRAALRRQRSAALWAVLTATCGTVSLLYLVGIGIAVAALAAARERTEPARVVLSRAARPLAITALGLAGLALLSALHAMIGSPGWQYGYIAGVATFATPNALQVGLGVLRHLHTAYRVLANHAWNLWANTSPAGFVGLLGPAVLVVALPLLANNLIRTQTGFSLPGFQNFPLYGFVALGSVAWVVVLLRRRRLWVLGAVLAGLMSWNAVGWFDAWSSGVGGPVESPAATALVKRLAHEIPAADEVVAAESFVGMFAGRAHVYAYINSDVIPITSPVVWFVLSTVPGTNGASGSETDDAIGTIEELPGVQTLEHDVGGVEVWRWHPRPGTRPIGLGTLESHYPLWMAPPPDVVAFTSGPPKRWHVRTDGKTVYLVLGDFFQLEPGRYAATLRLQSRTPITAEVWDLIGVERILAGKVVTPVRASNVTLHFVVPGSAAQYQQPSPLVEGGSGLFRLLPATAGPMPPTIELRVWVPPGTLARAWWVSIEPLPSS